MGHEKKWVPKKFRPIKNIDPKKLWVPKNFGFQKNGSPRIWVLKKVGPEPIWVRNIKLGGVVLVLVTLENKVNSEPDLFLILCHNPF